MKLFQVTPANVNKLIIVRPGAYLELLPDNIVLSIMFYLDCASIFKLSKVCKRFYHLSQDEQVWTNVDMCTLPYMDVRNVKKFIDLKLSSKLHTIKMQSSFGLKGRASLKPKIDNNILNALVEKCKNIVKIELLNCDLSFFVSTGDHPQCQLLLVDSIESVSLIYCNTLINWISGTSCMWPHLRHLSLLNSFKTSEFEIKGISNNTQWRTTLESLDLTGCYRINDKCVKSLCQNEHSSIRCLVLSGTSVTDNCLSYLPNLHRLEKLALANVKELTNNGLLMIPNFLPSLKFLDISSLSKADSSTCEQVAQTMINTTVIIMTL